MINEYELGITFDQQVETFRRAGCPRVICDRVQCYKGLIVHKAQEIKPKKNCHHFLGPVFKPAVFGYFGLLSLIRYKRIPGEPSLSTLSLINDVVEVAGDIYWIFNVDVGSKTENMLFPRAKEKISLESRSPLTLSELLTLCILDRKFKLSLRYHSGYALGSWYSEDMFGDPSVPRLSIRYSGFEKCMILSFEYFCQTYIHGVIPACERRYC